jgi:hypothetical protein
MDNTDSIRIVQSRFPGSLCRASYHRQFGEWLLSFEIVTSDGLFVLSVQTCHVDAAWHNAADRVALGDFDIPKRL